MARAQPDRRQRRRRRRVPAEPAHQRDRGARARRGLLLRAARPQGPHAGGHARPQGRRRARSGSSSSRKRWPPPSRTPDHVLGRARGGDRGPHRPDRERSRSPARRQRSWPGWLRWAPSTRTREATVDGVALRAVRTDVGLDLLVAADQAEALDEALAGRGIAKVDAEALEILRVESGRPRFGREMTTETIPQEAGHQRARHAASRRGATSVRRRSPGCTTGGSRTATCEACASPSPCTPAPRSGSTSASWDGRHRGAVPGAWSDRARDPPSGSRTGHAPSRSTRTARARQSRPRWWTCPSRSSLTSFRVRPGDVVREAANGTRDSRTATLGVLAGAALLSGACGEDDFPNDPRPASPVELTAAIDDRSVSVSPSSLGAGLVVLTGLEPNRRADAPHRGGPHIRHVRRDPARWDRPTSRPPSSRATTRSPPAASPGSSRPSSRSARRARTSQNDLLQP